MKRSTLIWIIAAVLAALLIAILIVLVLILNQMEAAQAEQQYLDCLARLGFPRDQYTEDLEGLVAATEVCSD